MAARLLQTCRRHLGTSVKYFSTSVLTVSEEVFAALHHGKPVVALETTIITHGMPHPQNLSTALEVESIVRLNGVVPASIGILDGQVHIGLSRQQLERLADPQTISIKTSRRDLPYVLSQGLNGGTTVSGTMVLAHLAGISIFVTGGIGGVHRGAETSFDLAAGMDVSADLTELGRTPVTVISAGVKSILDIGRTLEYLETEGVCVATYGNTKEFPAFFTRHSGLSAPYNVETATEAAQLIRGTQRLGLQTGTLIGVPIPEQYDTLGQEVESVIQSVVQEANDKGIHGKEVTPFILQRVNERTDGKSLEANIHLVKNNAVVGSQIAVELSRLKGHDGDRGQGHDGDRSQGQSKSRSWKLAADNRNKSTESSDDSLVTDTSSGKRVVVVGGSIVDFYAQMTSPNFQLNGATYSGHVQQSFGGVGRNLADGLTRLGVDTHFISATGDDSHRPAFEAHCSHMDLSRVAKLEGHSTATYCAVLRENGELMFGIGDMDIHSSITPQYISQYQDKLSSAALVCVDGNVSTEAIEYVCDVCSHHQVPVLYEPTDVHKAAKPFLTLAYRAVTYTLPNYNELRTMASHLSGTQLSMDGLPDDLDCETVLQVCTSLLDVVAKYIPVTIVTLGVHGLILCCQADWLKRLPLKGDNLKNDSGLVMQHFPAAPVDCEPVDIISVSGAGDCMVSAVIAGILGGYDTTHCVRAGLLAARTSLASGTAVPATLTPAVIAPHQVRARMNVTPSLLRKSA